MCFLSLGLFFLASFVSYLPTELLVLNLFHPAVSPSPNHNSPFSPSGNNPGYPSREKLARARWSQPLPAQPTSTGPSSEEEASSTCHATCIEYTATMEGDD